MTNSLLKYGIQQKLPLFEPAAGQPFNLQEKFRAEPAQQLLGFGFIPFEKQGRNHALAPGLVSGVVLPEGRVDGCLKTGFEISEMSQQLLLRHLFEILSGKFSG